MIYAINILIGISVFFAFAGTLGVLRMPDTYCRMQSSTNVTTFGVLGVLIGGFLYAIFMMDNVEVAIKMVLLAVFYIVTSPIAGHAMAKGAYWYGIKPTKMECDQYGEDVNNE